jgi:ATPase
VVDTVVYIEDGRVDTVYDVTTEVKVPEGLTAEDLARPVIQVADFETGTPEFEIYTFNRQVITVPIGDAERSESGVDRLARQEVEREIKSIARGHVEVELQGRDTAIVYVDEDDISTVIGKGGGRISDVEDRLGIDIDVRTHDERPSSGPPSGGGRPGVGGAGAAGASGGSDGITVTPEVTSRHVVIGLDEHVGETVEVRADDEYLFTATVGRGGEIQVSRGSAIADELEAAIDRTKRITVHPA